MKVTYRWMQEFVPIAATPAQLAEQLTLQGLEVEAVESIAPAFSGVVVGEVLSVARHPDAEKLSVCTVSTDGTNRLQIICGASNVRAGLIVAVAMIGAQLPNGVNIKRAKLRGLESEGMLCSARELGLGVESEGILELPPSRLGENLRTALDLDDVDTTGAEPFGEVGQFAWSIWHLNNERLTHGFPTRRSWFGQGRLFGPADTHGKGRMTRPGHAQGSS